MTQPTYSPPPPAAPAPEPAKKPFYKKAWFLVLAAIVVIAAFASQKGGASTSDAASGDSAAGESAAQGPTDAVEQESTDSATVGIGQPAADGDFQYVVNGVDCSQTQIGDQYFNTTAQGQFCLVDLTITNIGSESQSFLGDNATLFNAQGQEFSADTEAAIYLENADSLYEDINPGNTLNTKVVFDVPAGMVPSSIELHDSMLSGGVTVALQ
ncbi:DUF4352 domain-containing protein [Geodermatophilus sp. URMC 63]